MVSDDDGKSWYVGGTIADWNTCTPAILLICMHSGPRAKSMHLRPSCVCSCQLVTFLIVMDTYVYTYHENRSLIQSLVLSNYNVRS